MYQCCVLKFKLNDKNSLPTTVVGPPILQKYILSWWVSTPMGFIDAGQRSRVREKEN